MFVSVKLYLESDNLDILCVCENIGMSLEQKFMAFNVLWANFSFVKSSGASRKASFFSRSIRQ
jgi:hypothetical protein